MSGQSDAEEINWTDFMYYNNMRLNDLGGATELAPCSPRPARRPCRRRVNAAARDLQRATYSNMLLAGDAETTAGRRRRNTKSITKKVSRKTKKTSQRTEEPKVEENIRERSPLARNVVDCAICLETFEDQPLVSTTCGHVFCQSCLVKALRKERKCPTCRNVLRGKHAYHPIFLNRG